MPEYKNPKPIAVALVAAFDPCCGKSGLLVIRRAGVSNFPGSLALPSGYMEFGETWQESVVRELREETGVEGRAEDVVLHDVITSPLTKHLQVFGRIKGLDVDVSKLVPTREASEFLVFGSEGFETPFSTHKQAAAKFFENMITWRA